MGVKLFWAVPSLTTVLEPDTWFSGYGTIRGFNFGVWEERGAPLIWGRGKPLSRAEAAFFKALPQWQQDSVLVLPGIMEFKRKLTASQYVDSY